MMSLKREVVIALIAFGSLFITVIAFNAIAARLLTKEEFGIFQYIRNIALIFSPFLSVSQEIIILRSSNSKPKTEEQLLLSYMIFISSSLIVGLLIYLLLLLTLDFTDFLNAEIALILILISIGTAGSRIFEAGLRGADRIVAASVVRGPLNALVLCIVLAVLFSERSAQIGLYVLAVLQMSFAVAILIFAAKNWRIIGRIDMRQVKKLTRLGLPRSFAGCLRIMLFSFGFVALTFGGDMEAVAIYAVGLYFIRIFEVIIAAVTPTVLQRTAKLQAEDKRHRLSRIFNSAIELTLVVSAVYLTLLFIGAETLIKVIFGQKYVADSITIFALGAVSAPYLLFGLLRSLVEVEYAGAYNVLSLGLALVVQIIAFLFLQTYFADLISITLALFLSITTLAASSLMLSVRILQHRFSKVELSKICLIMSVNAFLGLFYTFNAAQPNSAPLFVLLCLAVNCLILLVLKPRFLTVLNNDGAQA